MLHLFGITLPTPAEPFARDVSATLAGRMAAAGAALQKDAPAALAASVRQDAQRYLAARRRGELRFAPGAGRACDTGAAALMRLTVNAPPVPRAAELLVA
jgi:hypothetical protein